MTAFTSPAAQLPRDRWGRPLIVPPDGGKPVPYTRATTVAGALDDLNGLMSWKCRMTAIGITDRPDLQLAISANPDDKQRVNRIVAQAMDAAAAGAAATTGTALHSFTEQIDRGQEPQNVPPAFAPDLDAYREATSTLTHLHIEQMSVLDDLHIAGTPDRIVEYQGDLVVADLKTGSIDYPGKIAAQLSLYAHAQHYNIATGQRSPWADQPVDTTKALIIHLPAGKGVCSLHWVDIAAGWEAVQRAMWVRDWRTKQRSLTKIIHNPTQTQGDLLTEAIEAAGTVEDLTALWSKHHAIWAPSHTAAAAARKTSLTAPAA